MTVEISLILVKQIFNFDQVISRTNGIMAFTAHIYGVIFSSALVLSSNERCSHWALNHHESNQIIGFIAHVHN